MITTKKISQILGVTIDELVSGEKLKENIENKPILVPKRENVIQYHCEKCKTVIIPYGEDREK